MDTEGRNQDNPVVNIQYYFYQMGKFPFVPKRLGHNPTTSEIQSDDSTLVFLYFCQDVLCHPFKRGVTSKFLSEQRKRQNRLSVTSE